MTPVLQPQLEKVTLEQYEMLPEEKRFEVFDGVVYDMASPSQVHQALSMQLSTRFFAISSILPIRSFSHPVFCIFIRSQAPDQGLQ